MNLRPLRDTIIVEKIDLGERKTSGGIIVPEIVDKDELWTGKVIAVGKGELQNGIPIKPDLRVGNIVYFEPHVGTRYTIDGKPYLIMRERYIVAVLHEPKTQKAEA